MYRYCNQEYQHKMKFLYQEFYHDDFLPIMLYQVVFTNISDRKLVEEFVTSCYKLLNIKKIKNNKRSPIPSIERVNNLYDFCLLTAEDLVLECKISQTEALKKIIELLEPEIYFEVRAFDTGGQFHLGNDFKMIGKNLSIKSIK